MSSTISQSASDSSARDGRAPTILFNITHGFQARMLLRSEIADHLLARGASLVIVSGAAGEDYFKREFSHPQIALEEMPERFSRVESHLINLRQYFLMNPSLGATLNHKNEAFRRERPTRYWFARAVNSVLGRIPPLRRAYISAESRIFPGGEFDELLNRYRPDLVVTGTPGLNRNDVHLMRAARRVGIDTATVMLSWDNLSSKGYMGTRPDHLLVWSDLMAKEAVMYHNFPRERIQWCGAAQFDLYHGIRERLDRDAWRAKHNIPPGRPLVVYGTINPAILPHEYDVLKQIVDAFQSNAFPVKPYLWVRLHPQVVRGFYSRSLEPYKALAGPDIFVEEPPVQSDKLPWDLPKKDAIHLAELMAASDIVMTTSSTLSIDAACAGTPIINVFFDGPQAVHPALSAKRFIYYTHYAHILETGGIGRAMNIEDLVRLTKTYIEHPETDRAGRESILRQQLNRLDGQAGARTAELLWDLTVSGSKRRATGAR
jgi:hypothetical protein